MFRRWMALLVLFLAVVLVARAQDDEGEGIRACTDEEIAAIDEQIDSRIVYIITILSETTADSVSEDLDDLGVEQRGFWNGVDTLPECAELYTRAYEAGRIIDHFTIALGMVAGAQIETMIGDDDLSDLMIERAERHVRQAKTIGRRVFGDALYADFFADG